jgi:ABC-type transport system involved in cytochrome c biogenesis ATPase subunit
MQNAMSVSRSQVMCHDVQIRTDRSLLVQFTWTSRPGGITWLTGSNGSGKSSLLRVLAGWQRPSGGSVHWHGVEGRRLQYFNPAMHAGSDLRVGDFVALVDRITPWSRHPALFALFPATAAGEKRFGQLSTGEAKRLLLWALLRAHAGPLLLDEPYEHLSREARASLTMLLRERAAGEVVIVATHQEVATREPDVTLAFNGDRIEAADAP